MNYVSATHRTGFRKHENAMDLPLGISIGFLLGMGVALILHLHYHSR